MMDQQLVNELSAKIRREVIFYLLRKEFLKHRQPIPEKEQLAFEIEEIAKLPCCTKQLKRLFEDVAEMRRERGIFPGPATIADLEFCCKRRSVGLACLQRVPMDFLPFREDKELRALPNTRELLEAYRKELSLGNKILLPQIEREEGGKVLRITRELSDNLRM